MAANLAVQAYDTLSIARNLEKEYAFDKKQAEGIARTIHEHLVSNVASKEDIENLGIELRAELRGEVVKINNRIDHLSKILTIRTGAMIAAAVGLLAALQTIAG